VGLVVAQTSICKDDAPHDFGQCHLLGQSVFGRDEPGELKMIQRLGSRRFGHPQKLPTQCLVKPEMISQSAFDVPLLFGTEFIIGVGQLKEQCTGSQLDLAH
jgi:hypothetical protein